MNTKCHSPSGKNCFLPSLSSCLLDTYSWSTGSQQGSPCSDEARDPPTTSALYQDAITLVCWSLTIFLLPYTVQNCWQVTTRWLSKWDMSPSLKTMTDTKDGRMESLHVLHSYWADGSSTHVWLEGGKLCTPFFSAGGVSLNRFRGSRLPCGVFPGHLAGGHGSHQSSSDLRCLSRYCSLLRVWESRWILVAGAGPRGWSGFWLQLERKWNGWGFQVPPVPSSWQEDKLWKCRRGRKTWKRVYCTISTCLQSRGIPDCFINQLQIKMFSLSICRETVQCSCCKNKCWGWTAQGLS